ncbi:uncharacterized protein TNCV_182971 [Trichonephila clavipes]|nr:uncharacterized protein TNCV_182971 [Trichonephila clavipes]
MQRQLSEFRRLMKQRRGPMLEGTLKGMMKTGRLGILPGRGRKRVNTFIVEDTATAVVEASSESLLGTVSVQTVSRTFDMPYSTVRHIMRKILNFYPHKIQAVHQLKPHDPSTHKTFMVEFLLRMEVGDSQSWNMLWTDEALFILIHK